MKQRSRSLFKIYSDSNIYPKLQDILNSPRVITITIGVYMVKNQEKYDELKDLPYLFTKEIDNIIADKPKAMCMHNNYTSTIYLYNECEAENYAICSEIYIWLKRLQMTLKAIHFCVSMDRRAITDANDIIISELMSYFRVFAGIHKLINRAYVIMGRRISFISEIKKVLNEVIEQSGCDLQSKDVMEISECLDLLINRSIGYGEVVGG